MYDKITHSIQNWVDMYDKKHILIQIKYIPFLLQTTQKKIFYFLQNFQYQTPKNS